MGSNTVVYKVKFVREDEDGISNINSKERYFLIESQAQEAIDKFEAGSKRNFTVKSEIYVEHFGEGEEVR